MWGVRGRALSRPRPLVLSGLRPGPTTHWLRVRGVRAWGPVTNPTGCALASWLCALWGRHEVARGGRLLPGCGASGVRRSPTPDHSFFRAWGPAPLPTGCGCGGCGRGDSSPAPQRALLRAGFAPCGDGMRVPWGGASCLGVGRPGTGALSTPTSRPFGPAAGAHYPLAVGAGGRGCGDPSPTPQRALLRAGFARCGGGMRAPGGSASCLGVGRPGTGALRPPTTRPFRRGVGARFPLAVGEVCGRGGRSVLGSLSRAAVLLVLRAPPGFTAPGGRCGLAPVLVPWLWPAACLSCVPRCPALVRCASSGPVTLGAPIGFPVAVVPSPTPGGCCPRLYWVAARGTWRPAENRALCACRWPLPRQGRWARSSSYPFGAPRWG